MRPGAVWIYKSVKSLTWLWHNDIIHPTDSTSLYLFAHKDRYCIFHLILQRRYSIYKESVFLIGWKWCVYMESNLLVLLGVCWAAASCCRPRVGLRKRRPLRRSSFCFMAARLFHSWTNLSTCREDATSHFILNFKPTEKTLETSSLTEIDSLDTGVSWKANFFFLLFQFWNYSWTKNKQSKLAEDT